MHGNLYYYRLELRSVEGRVNGCRKHEFIFVESVFHEGMNY